MVGLVTQGHRLFKVNAKREPDHLLDLMTALALAKAEGAIPLTALVEGHSSDLIPGNVAVVIAPGPLQGQTTLSQALYRRGIILIPVVLESASFNGDTPGDGTAGSSKVAPAESFVIRRGENLAYPLSAVIDLLVY
jgi:hypothetical protein